jgi:hypothetical protein
MTITAPSTALAAIQPAFTGVERLARAGSSTGYRGRWASAALRSHHVTLLAEK